MSAIGGVQKGSRSIPAVDHQVVGKASAQLAPGSGEQALAGGILAVARAVGFGVEGKRQAGSDDADADHLVGVTDHFFLGVVLRTAKLATSVNAVSGGGAIDGQANEPRILEGFVALGAMKHTDQSGARNGRVQTFGEVAQRIIAKRLRHA